jgi:outer membrane protein assembly factor BamB
MLAQSLNGRPSNCPRVKTACIVVTAFFASLATGISRAEDWPAWRGPRGDGVSSESSPPVHWSATEKVVWKTPVPGFGRSSPIVQGERVFVTTGDAADDSRRVLCFDRDSGRVLWNVAVHHGAGGRMHRLNTTASSTPAADSQCVYAVFIDDRALRVFALDHAGGLAWSASPGSFDSQHGFAASPVLYGEGVIVNGHQDGEAFVVLLRRDDGAEIWRYRPKINLRSFSTPVLIEHEGREQLILAGASQTVALDPRTGEMIWFAEGPSEKFVSTPAVGHGLVFSFGGSPSKRAMAVRLGGSGDVLATHVVWRNERSMPYVPSPVLAGDFLHVISDDGVYTCLDPTTGAVQYNGRKLGPVSSSPVVAAGRVYFFEDSGRCTVVENGAAFEVVAMNEIGEAVYTTPAFAAGSLFVRTESNLVRIGRSAR